MNPGRRPKFTVIALVLGLSALTGCGDGVTENDAVTVTSTVTASVEPTEAIDQGAPGDIFDNATDEEQGFMLATCEILDDGIPLEFLTETLETRRPPFTPERTGQLIATAIQAECPAHYEQMAEYLGFAGS